MPRRVAGQLDIPFYVLNFEEDFGRVIDYFVSEYNRGRTPNPCVRCNDWLKFGKLAKYAEAVGAEFVASGHYARIGVDPTNGEKVLMRGLDHRKDQSYVLFGMSRDTLDHTLLPIGGYREARRPRHRARTESAGLQQARFAGNLLRAQPGLRRPWSSAARPRRFTPAKSSRPTAKSSPPTKAISISPSASARASASRSAIRFTSSTSTPSKTASRSATAASSNAAAWSAHQINILSSRPREAGSMKCTAKIRYNHSPQPATLKITGPDEIEVRFDAPQPAITPGQAVVCYDNDIVLAGGWIDRAI